MKIGFIGSPYSGKTTTAAMLFARLKREGVSAEYMPEYARSVIRTIKNATGLDPDEHDQMAIMWGQREGEDSHVRGTDYDHIVITDGSTVNSLFYMPPDFVKMKGESSSPMVQANRYDLLFYCEPVFSDRSSDQGRIHDKGFSEAMDGSIKRSGVLEHSNVVSLDGTPEGRLEQAHRALWARRKAQGV